MMWNPWSELERLRREMDGLFSQANGSGHGEFPLVNVYTGEEAAVLTAELPGINPNELEITAKNNVLTIQGQRTKDELKENERYLKYERGEGKFVRSFAMPFEVDAGKISASYRNGILQIHLPRAEADKPKKITVAAG